MGVMMARDEDVVQRDPVAVAQRAAETAGQPEEAHRGEEEVVPVAVLAGDGGQQQNRITCIAICFQPQGKSASKTTQKQPHSRQPSDYADRPQSASK